MLTTEFRRFQLDDGKIVMTPDRSGEFIHINDIELWLREQKRQIEQRIIYYNKKESLSEHDKLYVHGLNEQIEILDSLINAL
ncbi:MAG: hypothetical protein IKO36_00680 [Bacteroidaceae bacterium]|nr:hypothetical protein [Bacteroidaceae bacterium]